MPRRTPFWLLALVAGCTTFVPETRIGEQEGDTDDCELAACDDTLAPCITLDPVVLNFGVQLLFDPPGQRTLTVGNPCDGALTIDALTLDDDTVPFLLEGSLDAVEPGGTGSVVVTFVPAQVGIWTTTLSLASNDPRVPVEVVSLAGQAACNPDALDSDFDGVQDGCDICEAGADHLDEDADTVPDACDLCPWHDDTEDDDQDTIPDACDLCPDGDDRVDSDGDSVPDDCDACAGHDDALDADGDGTADGCDLCPGEDDRIELDGDGVPDGCDLCAGFDDNLDGDGDSVPDGCDVCEGHADQDDADADAVPDGCDVCDGGDDLLDVDGDSVPDACDDCAIGDDLADLDGDGVADACDLCPGFDDLYDPDGDGFPDGCDLCPGYDNGDDDDGDGMPDGCDACPGFDDRLDGDNDLVPDDCDVCEGFADADDADGDTVPDGCDLCEGFDDAEDGDLDAVPDGCDACEGFDDAEDGDGDSVPNACDACPGHDDRDDGDEDGVPDMCDACEGGDDLLDGDGDAVPDACDLCEGGDDSEDADLDEVPDLCDACPDEDDRLDDDLDGTPDACDVCPGFSDAEEADGDGVPDGCDMCPGGDDGLDDDEDGVADHCDMCPDFPDDQDLDRDGLPDLCDSCPGFIVTDYYDPNTSPRTDLLFVVDNSGSMGEEQVSLGANFDSFIDEMVLAGADWRLAVITTDDPRFVGPPIYGDDPDAAELFAEQVLVGTNGNGLEGGIKMAFQSTSPPLGHAAPGNGWWREDAMFAAIFISDENDGGLGVTPEMAYGLWSFQKQDADLVVAHAIVADVPDGCPGAYEPGYGFYELVMMSGGEMLSICDENWGDDLATIAKASLADLVYPLGEVPVASTLVVYDDGIPTFAGWVYDRVQNAVVFDGTNRPDPGSYVTIDYVLDCDGTLGACADGLDNDGDALTDWPEEPGCRDRWDTNENDPVQTPACTDGLDNDGDGATDHPDDPECASAAHGDEACTFVGIDAFGYQLCEKWPGTPPCPDLTLTGTPLPLGDEGTVLTPIGFDFDFYGHDRSTVYVGANGTLDFVKPVSDPSNVCLPAPNGDTTLFVYWDDLNPAGGAVYVRTAGVPPQRTFSVQWAVPHVNGSDLLDVRVVLHEGTNDIDLCYVDTELGPLLDHGESATVGIQGTNTIFLEHGCFGLDLVPSGLSLHIDHPYGP